MKNIQIFTALIAVSFILIVGIVIRYTSAADVTATAEITNTAPTVDTIRVATTAYGTDTLTSSGILPTIGNNRTIHINGQITDLNGETDIASSTLSLVFHKTTSTNACTADKNDCYRITSCATDYTTGDDTQITYNCEVPLAYWIDATDAASIYESDNWTAYVAVSDIATAQGTLTSTIEVNSLLALNLPEAIDYGTRSLGEISSSTTNVATILTQRGNTKADVEVSGTDMSCTLLGTIPVAAQKWSLTDVNHAAGTALTTSAAAAARNLDLRTDDTNELTANLYWNIAIPSTGVKGICSGSNTMAIIAQAGGSTAWEPSDDAALAARIGMHFRADELTAAGALASWSDVSGNSRNIIASGATQPTAVASVINGYSTVRFDGTTDYLDGVLPSGEFGGNISKTVYMVDKLSASSPVESVLFHYGSPNLSKAFGLSFPSSGSVERFFQWGSDLDATPISPARNRWKITVGKKDGNALAMYDMGVIIGSETKTAANITDNTFRLGFLTSTGGGSHYYGGDIAEFIFVKDASSDAERQKIEGYLAHKYGIQSQLPSGHPYKTVAP